MAGSTPATMWLDKAGAAFTLHAYDYDSRGQAKGLQAADALGVTPGCVLKTLMILVDGRAACVMLASDRSLSPKAAAAALGGKAAAMMPPQQAERVTGYRVGGISPFGQRRPAPAMIDAAALAEAFVFLNGGRRGLQVRMAPAEVVRVLGCIVAPLSA